MKLNVLSDVADFINQLSYEESGKILAQLKFLEINQTEALIIKHLKGKIYELRVKQYRIVFFKIGSIIYIVNAFKKQSRKTPQRIIKKAEKIYKNIEKRN